MTGPSHRDITPRQRTRSKILRRDMTDAERKLWRLLRDRRLAACKFRRQEPLGPYILDFVCFSEKLIIEVDGGQHAESAADAVRDAFVAESGFRTLRYWNSDVLRNPEGVLMDILEKLGRVE